MHPASQDLRRHLPSRPAINLHSRATQWKHQVVAKVGGKWGGNGVDLAQEISLSLALRSSSLPLPRALSLSRSLSLARSLSLSFSLFSFSLSLSFPPGLSTNRV